MQGPYQACSCRTNGRWWPISAQVEIHQLVIHAPGAFLPHQQHFADELARGRLALDEKDRRVALRVTLGDAQLVRMLGGEVIDESAELPFFLRAYPGLLAVFGEERFQCSAIALGERRMVGK